jgi:hypothetical protein
MIASDRRWSFHSPAPSRALEELRGVAGSDLPNEYYNLLAFSNGGEGPLSIEPGYFALDTAEDAASNKRQRTFEEFFPGFFVFGGNGGGELIAFDLRDAKPWPIVMIDMTNIDLDESVVKIADNFPVFLEAVGLD